MVRNIIAAGSEEDCVSSYNCFNNFDCTNNGTTNCISDYSSLESYVKNDKAIVDKLTKTFYRTGHSPARFVRITYKFQIPAHNNDSENKNESSCISTERLYYWSESPVYLLGPRPLYYLSLFAINVEEDDVFIELPCLQANDQEALLSRLTYLV